MPDLSQKGASVFWKEYEDPMIYRVLSFMEGVEQWTLDGDPEIEAAMQKLGKELDDITSIELGMEDQFIRLGAYIKSARTLRILQAIDTAHPGGASKILVHAEETSKNDDDQASLFLRRNIVFERLRLLTRIFSPEKLALALKALEEDDND